MTTKNKRKQKKKEKAKVQHKEYRKIKVSKNETIRSSLTYKQFIKKYPNVTYDRSEKVYKISSKKKKNIKAKHHKKVTRKAGKSGGARMRHQVAVNYRYKGLDSGESIPLSFISIRAITTDPSISEKALIMAVRQERNKLERQGVDLHEYNSGYTGVEKKPISSKEDRQLNDGQVHIEVLKNRRVQSHILQ